MSETLEALEHKNRGTTEAYVCRIAVKRDKFGYKVTRRMKL
jgi:hypothetical protein